MKMNQCYSYGLMAAVAVWTASTAFAADNGQLDHRDASFIKDAARDGQGEVELGKLAAEKGQSQDIKALGQHLQMDHTKVNQELAQLAQSKGVTLPTEQARKEERAENRFENKTGADFDKAFAEFIMKDHEKDIKSFEKEAQDGKDADVKAFAEKTLAGLRQHLQMARNAGATVGVDQRMLSAADRFLASHNEGLGTAPGAQTGQSGPYNRGAASGSNTGNTPEQTQPK